MRTRVKYKVKLKSSFEPLDRIKETRDLNRKDSGVQTGGEHWLFSYKGGCTHIVLDV